MAQKIEHLADSIDPERPSAQDLGYPDAEPDRVCVGEGHVRYQDSPTEYVRAGEESVIFDVEEMR